MAQDKDRNEREGDPPTKWPSPNETAYGEAGAKKIESEAESDDDQAEGKEDPSSEERPQPSSRQGKGRNV